MLATLMVCFREGLEAFLVVAITLMYLRQTQKRHLIPAVYLSVAASLIFCVVLGVVFSRIGAWTPVWAGLLSLVAAALVVSCIGHMLRMGKHMKKHITEKLSQASVSGGVSAFLGVFLFVMLMITREGIEAATLLASLAQQSDTHALAWGGALGVGFAAMVAYLWTRMGHRINLAKFFQFTAVFLSVFAVQLVLYAFHEFTEANAVPLIDNAYWHIATEPYGPEGQYGSWVSYAMAFLPLFWLLTARMPRQQPALNG